MKSALRVFLFEGSNIGHNSERYRLIDEDE